MREYEVQTGLYGRTTTLQLSDEDAEARGLKPAAKAADKPAAKAAKAPANKQAPTPQNKAATADDKGDG
jgi:hypothetical protein